jgi:predicted RNase H-related nuclease YkuK (DUF458 family)
MIPDLTDEIFQSETYGKQDVDEIIGNIQKFLEEDSEAEYSLVIGTDSHEKRIPRNQSTEQKISI